MNTENKIIDLFKKVGRRNVIDKSNIKKKVLILSTPRSGSTFFCSVLNNTEKFGYCAEYFNQRYIYAYAKYTGKANVSMREYVDFVLSHATSPEGVFSVNAHISHVVAFQNKGFDILSLDFDCIIYVTRKNKVKQAISYARAILNDSWEQDDLDQLEQELLPDPIHIVNSLNLIANDENYFTKNLQPICNFISEYESFIHLDKTQVFHDIANKLNVSLAPELVASTQKQKYKSKVDLEELFYKAISNDTVEIKKAR